MGIRVQNKDNINVAVVLVGNEGYGIQQFLITDCKAAKDHGINFHYICLHRGELYEKLLNLGADVKIVGGKIPRPYPPNLLKVFSIFFSDFISNLKTFKKGRNYLKKTRPYLVYTHDVTLNGVGGLAAKSCGIKSVRHFHGQLNRRRNWGLSRILLSCWLSLCTDMGLSVSKSVRESLWGRLRGKTYVLYNGIRVKEIEDSIRLQKEFDGFSDVDLVCVGRLVGWKNQGLVIDAIKILACEGLPTKLVLVGGPVSSANSHYVKLRDQVSRLRLEKNVLFAGFDREPAVIVSKAKASVLCSSIEPFGLVVVEAMACKTAVVVADAAGPGEIVKHGETGLKFWPDDAKSLAECLRKVLTDEELRRQLVEKAYADVLKNYTAELHMCQLREKFCSILNQS